MMQAQLPEDCQHFSFESYLTRGLAPSQRESAEAVQTFVQTRLSSYTGRKRGLYLYGSYGTGKTGLSVSALRLALAAGRTVLYLPTSKLFKVLYQSIAASQRMAMGEHDEETLAEQHQASKLLKRVSTVAWLVLDDLGVECASRFVVQQLHELLEERRHKATCFTIWTCNHDAPSLQHHWREEGRRSMTFHETERIIERLGESCMVLHLVGQNLREGLEHERRVVETKYNLERNATNAIAFSRLI
jgi:DNA replication protein DnaC